MSTLLLPAIFSTMIGGCAMTGNDRVAEGSAVYRLMSPDCEVEVISARAYGAGNLIVGEDCSLVAEIETVDGAQTVDLIQKVLEVVRP